MATILVNREVPFVEVYLVVIKETVFLISVSIAAAVWMGWVWWEEIGCCERRVPICSDTLFFFVMWCFGECGLVLT